MIFLLNALQIHRIDYAVRIDKTKEANDNSSGKVRINRGNLLEHIEKLKSIEIVRPTANFNKKLDKSQKVTKIHQNGSKKVALLKLCDGWQKILYVENGALEFECVKSAGTKIEFFLIKKQEKWYDEILHLISNDLWKQNSL